ncbi:MAG: hypothetical protein CO073_03020 [Candidatus Komeilibacteria bacterium CG_4_9_14_0_8_um_filter_36_9]|uniref:Uncharacterized protein n=1 Tax=Candidatus Komeilibacteria bacterium CG_4_9_14_0_8_um_filter_36_9 TaxID=1974473 RepID=A0A2M8DR05_9BACT|nr:MAG: hypothetical protein CO073_03020 [Candidatus Komeilibacteria bacterium CG_4_9_14_0_8_um_filter_36_9]
MSDKEIEQIYNEVKDFHSKYLTSKGVSLTKLKNNNGTYTKDALVLVYLAKDYPKTKIVSKKEITDFVKNFYPDVTDVQQARHLSMQQGWNILSSTRGDSLTEDFPKDSYKLVDLKTPYPAFAQERREGFSGNWEEIKSKYNNRCATCGSEEGKEHIFRSGVITKLQQGHLDPQKPLQEGNIFPQCQICNRGDRNRWIYDKTGRVIEIAETPDGVRVVKTFLKKASNKVRYEIFNLLKKLGKFKD